MNVVVWFGGSLFFTLAVAPTFFTEEMTRTLTSAYAGLVAQKVLERFFLLQFWCGAIAIVHQLAEWVYLGRVLPRLSLYVLGGVVCLGLVGGFWLQPKLGRLHQVKYCVELTHRETYSQAERERARKSWSFWHGLAQGINVLALIGLGFYTWRLMNPPDPTRYIAPGKFHG